MRCAKFLSHIILASILHLQHVQGSPAPQTTGTSSLVAISAAPQPTYTYGSLPGSFASVDKATNLFSINGSVQPFAGINAWWLSYTKNNSDIDRVLGDVVKSGLSVVRVWGFGDVNDSASATQNYFQVLQRDQAPFLSVDSQTGIPVLDYVISSAEKQNVKIILALSNGANGSMDSLTFYAAAHSTDKKSFFTNPATQKDYMAYVSFIVNRYKASPAIFSWEICNEPQYDCDSAENCDSDKCCDTSIITKWATTVSQHIKSLDPAHMVSLGDEGWIAQPYNVPAGVNTYPYNGPKGINFTANLEIPSIDFGTVHMYTDLGGETYDWGNTYIHEHAEIAKSVGKPVILEEYGVEYKVSNRTAILQGWQETVIEEKLAGDLLWQMGEMLTGTNPVDDYRVNFDEDAGSEWEVLVVGHAQNVTRKRA
ncbi:MAG: hypothetical protein LQ352_004476 [Teloschistes flavicans]|nr:MAG: hypothetical protein LQ352_004476 [Teloschistes flavicans]